MINTRQNGNIIFMILIVIALFAALTYAVTNTQRSSGTAIQKERDKITQGEIDSYLAAIEGAKTRLQLINNCSSFDYTPPASQGAGDKSCHIFHPNGGGVAYRVLDIGICIKALTELAEGEACGSLIYAGTSGGRRIYTTLADAGSYTWNNGSANWTDTGALDTANGKTNTDILVGLSDAGAPYAAAGACRNLGAEWYLPAPDELSMIYSKRNVGALSGTFMSTMYWTSKQQSAGSTDRATRVRFQDGIVNTQLKSTPYQVRCVRTD